MTLILIAVAAAVIVLPLVLGWSLCRAAARGDQMMDRLNNTEGDG